MNTTSPVSPVTSEVPSTGLANIIQQAPGTAMGINVLDTITKDDILCIARSDEEDRLGAAQAAANKELAKLNTKLVTLNEDMDKLADTAVEEVDMEGAQSAAKALNSTFSTRATASANKEPRDDDHKRFLVTIRLTQPGRYNGDVDTITSKVVWVPYKAQANNLLKDIRLAQRAIRETQIKLIALKSELSNLPVLERRIKAQIAKQVLNRTQEGRDLLTSMRGVKPAAVEVVAA